MKLRVSAISQITYANTQVQKKAHFTDCFLLVAGLLLIEKENDTRSWDNFLFYFSHNAMPT
jgi:hypothetical protein